MHKAAKPRQEGHEKKAKHTHWLQDLDLGCLTQAGDLYHLLDEENKAGLINYVVTAMQGVPQEIQMRQIGHFMKADPVYGEAVAEALGIMPANIRQVN